MKRNSTEIAPDIDSYLRLLTTLPWFRNLGKPHPNDDGVVRIHRWEEWPGPEKGYVDWFGRWQSVIREQLERIDGHWPCDYAEEPPGYLDESALDMPSGKLMVY
jgi:hypothetical protein